MSEMQKRPILHSSTKENRNSIVSYSQLDDIVLDIIKNNDGINAYEIRGILKDKYKITGVRYDPRTISQRLRPLSTLRKKRTRKGLVYFPL